MSRDELRMLAGPLYDGGWRFDDREQLKADGGFDDREIRIICERLQELDKLCFESEVMDFLADHPSEFVVDWDCVCYDGNRYTVYATGDDGQPYTLADYSGTIEVV